MNNVMLPLKILAKKKETSGIVFVTAIYNMEDINANLGIFSVLARNNDTMDSCEIPTKNVLSYTENGEELTIDYVFPFGEVPQWVQRALIGGK